MGSKAYFSKATTPRCRRGCYSLLCIAPLNLDPFLIMMCHARMHQVPFLSLWYDSTCDRTPVFQAISDHPHHYANERQSRHHLNCKYSNNINECILNKLPLRIIQLSRNLWSTLLFVNIRITSAIYETYKSHTLYIYLYEFTIYCLIMKLQR